MGRILYFEIKRKKSKQRVVVVQLERDSYQGMPSAMPKEHAVTGFSRCGWAALYAADSSSRAVGSMPKQGAKGCRMAPVLGRSSKARRRCLPEKEE